jgi:hypothetical protein
MRRRCGRGGEGEAVEERLHEVDEVGEDSISFALKGLDGQFN